MTKLRATARAGRAGGAPVEGTARVQRIADDGSRTVRWVLSDGSVDRMGDTIDPFGWNLSAFKKNPIVLWSHLSSEPPIGRMHGPWVENGKLIGDVEFADAATYPFADDIFRLVQGGFIKAGSVGFLPTKFQFSDDKNRPLGIDYIEQELLEFSIACVPANSNALILAQAKGLRTAPLRGLRCVASAQLAARVRAWARETAEPEEALPAKLRRLTRKRLLWEADLSTAEERAHYVRRLRAFHAGNGGRLVDPRAAAAEAAFRTLQRW